MRTATGLDVVPDNGSASAGPVSTGITSTQIAVRIVGGMLVMAAALFGSAGTFRWPEVWLYIVLQSAWSTALALYMKRHDPDLLRERMKLSDASARDWDRRILRSSFVLFIPYLLLPGLDAIRYQWSTLAVGVKLVGFTGVALCMLLIARCMLANRYLTRVVEIQRDRGHRVVSTGPYGHVRHPMYVGVIGMLWCLPLGLGSLWTLVPAAALTALIVLRTHFEDRLLQAELEGYAGYAQRVRYRLIPGLW